MAMTGMAAVVEGRLATFAEWRRRHPLLSGDVLFSAVLLALSAYFLYASVRLGLTNRQQAAPGTFPAVVSAGLVVCSAIWLTGALVKLRSPNEAAAATPSPPAIEQRVTESGAGDSVTSETANWRVIFVIAWSALLLPLTETIGMVPMLFVYLVGLFTVIARVSILKSSTIIGVVLLLFAWGAYEGRIYLPDPLRIGRTIHDLMAGLLGG